MNSSVPPVNTIAIDFGSSRTKVAYRNPKNGRVQLAKIGREGHGFFPSLIHCSTDPKEPIRVGYDAEDAAQDDPVGLVYDLKRRIHKGASETFDETRPSRDRLELLAGLFGHIKTFVEKKVFGGPVHVCCLTLPAKCYEQQKDAIVRAAKRAGFAEIRCIEEPVAAAIAWGEHTLQRVADGPLLVCDVGGGTTDFAIVEVQGGKVDLSVDAQTECLREGGNDIDQEIWAVLMKEAEECRKGGLSRLKVLFQRKIQSMRERLGGRMAERFDLERDVTVGREQIASVQEQFVERVASHLRGYYQKNQELFAGHPSRILLVGGGAQMDGMESAVVGLGIGEVITWEEADCAVVMGAVGSGFGSAGDDYTKLLLGLAGSGEILQSEWEGLMEMRLSFPLTENFYAQLEKRILGATLAELCPATKGSDRFASKTLSSEEVSNCRFEFIVEDPHLGASRGETVELPRNDLPEQIAVKGCGEPGRFGGDPGDLIIRIVPPPAAPKRTPRIQSAPPPPLPLRVVRGTMDGAKALETVRINIPPAPALPPATVRIQLPPEPVPRSATEGVKDDDQNSDGTLECPHCENEFEIQSTGTYECPHCEEGVVVSCTCPHCSESINARKWGDMPCPSCRGRFNRWDHVEVSAEEDDEDEEDEGPSPPPRVRDMLWDMIRRKFS